MRRKKKKKNKKKYGKPLGDPVGTGCPNNKVLDTQHNFDSVSLAHAVLLTQLLRTDCGEMTVM